MHVFSLILKDIALEYMASHMYTYRTHTHMFLAERKTYRTCIHNTHKCVRACGKRTIVCTQGS